MSYNNILVKRKHCNNNHKPSYKTKCINTVTIKELHQAFEELEKIMKHE
jgi:hypothetical protein